MSDGFITFMVMVFAAAFLLSQGMIVPVFGERRRARQRLQKRLANLSDSSGKPTVRTLVRERYLQDLRPFERRLESLRLNEWLSRAIEQSGHKILAYRLVLLSIALAVIGAIVGWVLTRSLLTALVVAVIAGYLPFIKIFRDRTKQLEKFDEQLPDAIDIMRRAMQAGHPFSETLNLVAEDMEDPVSREFAITFADINYGNDVRRAMLGLLQRIPTVTVMALVTAILLQKETGGNLTENLENIGKVIRARYRFQRKVRTLSAEGRASAWILALVPLGLFGVISVSTPSYLPILLEEPVGQKMIGWAAVLALLGILWMRRIIRIDV
jgi:tight adherence protein B